MSAGKFLFFLFSLNAVMPQGVFSCSIFPSGRFEDCPKTEPASPCSHIFSHSADVFVQRKHDSTCLLLFPLTHIRREKKGFGEQFCIRRNETENEIFMEVAIWLMEKASALSFSQCCSSFCTTNEHVPLVVIVNGKRAFCQGRLTVCSEVNKSRCEQL